jgi:hypothetical protein
MAVPLKWSYKTGLETDWCKSTADQKTRMKAVNKIFSASIGQNCVVLVDDKSEKKTEALSRCPLTAAIGKANIS